MYAAANSSTDGGKTLYRLVDRIGLGNAEVDFILEQRNLRRDRHCAAQFVSKGLSDDDAANLLIDGNVSWHPTHVAQNLPQCFVLVTAQLWLKNGGVAHFIYGQDVDDANTGTILDAGYAPIVYEKLEPAPVDCIVGRCAGRSPLSG